jgi:hypothetical protein
MKKMIRYTVKPEKAAENEGLVRAVYEELHRTQPDGIHYATFKLDEGVSFVHLHSNESHDAANVLADLETFKAFQRDIAERCDAPPVVTELHKVGTFRLFED